MGSGFDEQNQNYRVSYINSTLNNTVINVAVTAYTIDTKVIRSTSTESKVSYILQLG